MTKPPLPQNEPARLDALRTYEVLDTPPERAFDDFTVLAAHICQTPIALISLLDEDRQFFKSAVGLTTMQTPRDVSFCGHAVLKDELFVVPDAALDVRFADNPLVTGEPRIRFYAGAPLVTPQGQAVGTLCVIDRVPRELGREQQEALRALGRQVVGQLELRRALHEQRRAQAALAEANTRLESKVTQRTAEVERMNESLRTEIAARAQVFETLAQERNLLRALIDNLPSHIFVKDAAGRYLVSNRAHTRLLGAANEAEVVGRAVRDFFTPETARQFAADDQQVLQTGQAVLDREEPHQADGRQRWFLTTKVPLRDTQGGAVGILGIKQDITERKHAAQALHEAEARLETVVENMTEGLVISDLDGNLLHWNRAALQMHGFTSLDEVRRQFREFTAIYELATLDGAVMSVDQWPLPRVIRGETVRDVPIRVRRLNSDWERIFSYNGATVRDASGRQLAFLTISDVTERKRALAALREERASLARRVAERTADLSAANAELARAARLKDEFLANMSHELRTPLHAVLGMSEVLLEQLHGPLNERQQKYLTNVATSGRHLLALINDILDLSKIGAGKLELIVDTVSVAALCRASLQLVREAAYRKDIRLASRVDPQLETLPGDERRLKQVLVNLLSNAVKFTPEHGEVGLDVEGDAARQTVRFTVWDTGIGIAPEDLEKLFQPFVQLDSGLARAHGGTGLGLALVYRMTEMHGGSVSVTSEPGKGSRFTVSLPWPVARSSASPPSAIELALEAKPGATEAACEAELRTTAPLILLAEDNEANITTLADYLQAKGCRLLIARNGREAVAHAHTQRPDLVLMDIQMPVMDGVEAIRQLRADPATGAVPIIALTALAMAGDRERCLAAGADEYVSKPFVLRELLATMNALLAGQNAKRSFALS